MLPTPTDAAEERTLADIDAYGLHIINVLEEGDEPPFSYSVGLWHSYGHPEVIIVGMRRELAQWILNEIARRIREDGERFEPDRPYGGFLEGFDCIFLDTPKSEYRNHVGWDVWLYDGLDFPLMQCVWPTTSGIFPWEERAPEGFSEWQRILGTNSRTA